MLTFFLENFLFFCKISFFNVLKVLSIIVPILLAVAFWTLVERKVMADMQRRLGPNVVGFAGLLQPFADGLKLIAKETIIPSQANRNVFIFSPIITFSLSMLGWAVVPFGYNAVYSDLNVGLLYIFAISSLGVYGIIMSGWSSNSKYAFLGSLRSAAQMISYEVSIGLIVINILLCVGSLNLSNIVFVQEDIWFILPHFPIFVLFFVSALAETNRPPFDLPEAEAELVAGYYIEYSAMGFALFFLGECSSIILMSSLCTILFLGGWLPPIDIFPFNLVSDIVWFALKTVFIAFCFVWVRAAYPRYRYDQLMRLGWTIFLPLSLAWVVFTSSILLIFDWLP